MKLIEGMKLKKELQKKAEDLRGKISKHAAHLDLEGPTYKTEAEQRQVMDGWLQAHMDIVRQMRKLGVSIQRTNLETAVDLPIAGKPTKLCIAEWILRRRELAGMEKAAWSSLSDKGLRDQVLNRVSGEGTREVKVIRYFDPKQRDQMVDFFTHEPSQIDRKLEVINATTDLIGYDE